MRISKYQFSLLPEFAIRFDLYNDIKRYIRRKCRQEIFPIKEDDRGISENEIRVSGKIQSKKQEGSSKYTNSQILQDGKDRQLHQIGSIGSSHQGSRLYDSDGLAKCLSANGGGVGAKTGIYCVASRGRGNDNKQTLESNIENITNTLTSVQKDNLVVATQIGNSEKFGNATNDKTCFTLRASEPNGVKINTNIRRLVPKECERLQGFEDNWTEKGIDEKGNEILISDSQRYKMCGNAISVPVVELIARQIKKFEEEKCTI